MNSSEHFKAAEKLLSDISYGDYHNPRTHNGELLDLAAHANIIAQAHVHAALARCADHIDH